MLTDVKEQDDHYDVQIDLPGFKKEDISVELNDGYLTVSANKGLEEEEKNKAGKIIRQERYSGMMSRSFYVGEDISAEQIHGKYEGGVLTLKVPKIENKQIENHNRIMIE
jgi:HSP20 family molecular chaperone IbpA